DPHGRPLPGPRRGRAGRLRPGRRSRRRRAARRLRHGLDPAPARNGPAAAGGAGATRPGRHRRRLRAPADRRDRRPPDRPEPPRPPTDRTRRSPGRAAGQAGKAPATSTAAAPGAEATPGTSRDGTAPAQLEPHGQAAVEETVAAVLTAAGYPASTHRPGTGWD